MFPLDLNPASRIASALRAYCNYLYQTLWPLKLSFFYPYTEVTDGETLWYTLLFCMITLLAIKIRDKAPWLLVGWSWFVILLLPVIGLVRIGLHSHADRYTYLPVTGLFLVFVWGASEMVRRIPSLRIPLIHAFGLVVVLFASLTWETLYTRAIAINNGNWLAHNNLGAMYAERGDSARAEQHVHLALKLRPDYDSALYNLALLDESAGRLDSAALNLDNAIRLRPSYDQFHQTRARIYRKIENSL